jgi:hypothetical protein
LICGALACQECGGIPRRAQQLQVVFVLIELPVSTFIFSFLSLWFPLAWLYCGSKCLFRGAQAIFLRPKQAPLASRNVGITSMRNVFATCHHRHVKNTSPRKIILINKHHRGLYLKFFFHLVIGPTFTKKIF